MVASNLLKSIRDDIYHIDIPIGHPLKNLNLYLFVGEESALIDTGPYHPMLDKLLQELLLHLGITDISKILLTHSHIDHFGMAARLRAATGAEVMAHHAEKPRVERPHELLQEEYRNYASLAAVMGFPREFIRIIPDLAGVWMRLSEPCIVDVELNEGDRLRTGDRTLRVIHTPGHTVGHLCYLEEGEGLLFSGDHLIKTITPNPEIYWPPREGRISGLPQFLDSLRLLEGLDASCAYPGHGGPISSISRRIDMNLLHHGRRLEKTREAVRGGYCSVWEVALYLFPQIREASPSVDHFLAMREAIGQLVILEDGGEVRRIEEEGIWLYQSTGIKKPSDQDI
ncbi:MAG: MBL fold metallo-hydrolase [Actinomycetota bacterium]|nr:MBL fold metallo-hydrolase [Actinomycetota bacterium]